jgi:4-alpha-glucanotransferase
VADGLVPNTFPGNGGAPAYNSADAALWLIAAWQAYWLASGDRAALGRAFPVLAEIVSAYARGTRYGIGVDPADGLVHAGAEGAQLTWMDAKVGEWVVTPRRGKPVEVNALWVNALRAMTEFATALEADPAPYRRWATAAEAGLQRFVRGDGHGLLDVLDGPEGSEDALRPNQILAVSLPHSALGPAQQAAVVSACRRELVTSYGLRSLAPGHPDYRGHYGGDVAERDGAYHQGPVWAWLLGPYALAEYRVTGDADAARARLRPLGDHLADAGLGQVSEIFDGDPPHEPRGAPAQAWSAACALEAWWRLGGNVGGGNRP